MTEPFSQSNQVTPEVPIMSNEDFDEIITATENMLELEPSFAILTLQSKTLLLDQAKIMIRILANGLFEGKTSVTQEIKEAITHNLVKMMCLARGWDYGKIIKRE